MNKLTLKRIAAFGATLAILAPVAVFAQTDVFGINAASSTGLTSTDIRTTIGRIIQAFMGLLGIVAVVIILMGGFRWMTAMGDQGKVDEAKKLMISGVIGLVIIVSAYAIARFVLDALVKSTT